MRKHWVLSFLAAAALLGPGPAFAEPDQDGDEPPTCGNTGDRIPPPPKNCPKRPAPDCATDMSGAAATADEYGSTMVGDPVNPHQANLTRMVTDIQTFGPAPIAFTRFYNSRTLSFNSPYWDFGSAQTWQHNWNYEVRQLSTTTFGFWDIKVRYPDGREDNFKATDTSGAQLAPEADSGDRLYSWGLRRQSTVGHLQHADLTAGSRMHRRPPS